MNAVVGFLNQYGLLIVLIIMALMMLKVRQVWNRVFKYYADATAAMNRQSELLEKIAAALE